MKPAVAHVRRLWPRATVLVLLPLLAYGALLLARGDMRWDLAIVTLGVPALGFLSASTKRLCVGVLPLALTGLLYDAMRFFQGVNVSPSTVHVCDLRELELRFFGIEHMGQRITLHDWLQARSTPLLDLYCAIPYGTFILAIIVFALFLYARDFAALQRFAWAFFLLNVAGFITYHVYPAAPPWYWRAYGCVVDVHAPASEGPNLARVDLMLGVGYFRGMYGRASDVFGAVPSLHVTYPLLICLEGWALFGWKLRTASVAFFLSMCFAAVYLDHHWVIDAVVGVTYCLAVFGSLRLLARSRVTGLAVAEAGPPRPFG